MAAPTGDSVGIDPDDDLIRQAVVRLAQRTRFPVAFGGMMRGDAVHVNAVAGARTHHLDGLIVRTGRGLGGRAVVETRPRLTLDYRTAKGITHDYDAMVLGEGIATLFAVPVVVSGTPRGVLYCGSWGQAPVAEAAARPAFAIADEVAAELRIRDEVRRRLSRLPAQAPALAPAAQEELRATYAELRRVGATVRDAGLRERLAQIEKRLAALSADHSPIEVDVSLSPRETDVLACVALGSTNAQIAAALGLKEVTVKSYLAQAMAKLDASTRHSAVAKARRAGILP
ncbi:helix-turn-helix transcriptional regulator [Microbacterium luticocti]|uniref:helix-turn-helix transcriptional regulator n=1 Tax=Microbacterium luticocti TaxID=451764 RepID=UPI0003FEF6DB|nr:helix-turn-helix transcriptional regulator [Microbacterium luticocti]